MVQSGPCKTLAEALIPNHFHFIWLGGPLPDFARFAIHSALRRNEGSHATLWLENGLHAADTFPDGAPAHLELRTIEPQRLFHQVEAALHISEAEHSALYHRLTQHNARANLIRMVVLYLFGGVYLDTDTLTLKDFSPLRKLAGFCGEEPTLWPAGTSLLDPRAILLGELRRACSLVPRGYRLHRKLVSYHTMAANNAVLGARARHPILGEMLKQALRLPEAAQIRRYRLGTHLLQSALRGYGSNNREQSDRMHVMPSQHFYPLGPEISRHYFRRYQDPAAVADELLGAETFVVHWYASVSALSRLDAEHVVRTADQCVYSFLCREHIIGSGPKTMPTQLPSPA